MVGESRGKTKEAQFKIDRKKGGAEMVGKKHKIQSIKEKQ